MLWRLFGITPTLPVYVPIHHTTHSSFPNVLGIAKMSGKNYVKWLLKSLMCLRFILQRALCLPRTVPRDNFVGCRPFHLPLFYSSSNLSRFASGRSNALVVDSGGSMTSVVPVYDAFVLKKGR